MEKYLNWNINKDLWKNIETVFNTLQKEVLGEVNEDAFKAFSLDKGCYNVKAKKDDSYNFVNKGTLSLTKSIYYPEGRNGENSRRWNKEKTSIENIFRMFFPKFTTPEQSYRAIVNPLLNRTINPVLFIEDMESKLFSFQEICRLFNIQTNGNIFEDWVSFQFNIKKEETSLENATKTGINEIEGGNTGYLVLNIIAYIETPLDYCCYVINSETLSEVLYWEYLNQQLQAYFGYNEYPNDTINNFEIKRYFFDTKEVNEDFWISYPAGQIYAIMPQDMTYAQYLDAIKPLYDRSKQEIVGNLYDIDSIKNRVLAVDRITQQIVYTDDFGKIQKLDLLGAAAISKNQLKSIAYSKFEDENIQDFLKTLKGIYYHIPQDSYLDFDSIVENIEKWHFLKDININSYPEFVEILNVCYNHWKNVNFNIISKMKNLAYIYCTLFIKDFKEEAPKQLSKQEVINIKQVKKFPIGMYKLFSGINDYKNQLLNFSLEFRDEFFINKISNLILNGKIKRPAIITSEDLEVYNRLENITGGKFNGVILNQNTLRDMYSLMGDKIVNYFNTLAGNTIFIINPDIFFESSILGNTELNLANKVSFRPLIAEFLKAINLDYIVAYKNRDYDLKDLVPTCLRCLFENCKYRVIYGNINPNDALILDPNLKIAGKENLSDLKDSSLISREEVEEGAYIFDAKNNTFLFTLPQIKEKWIDVEIPKVQNEFYQELVNLGFNNLQNNEDYSKKLLTSDLDNCNELTPYFSNYLSQADIFLNAPDSDLFLFKDKFEGNENNPALVSEKVDLIYSLIFSHLNSGIVRGERRNKKEGKVLVICENREVIKHLLKHLSRKFRENELFKFEIGNKEEVENFNSNYRVGFMPADIFNMRLDIDEITTYIFPQNSWDMAYYIKQVANLNSMVINNKVIEETEIESFMLTFDNSLEVNKMLAALSYFIEEKSNQYLGKEDFSYEENLKNLPYNDIFTEEIKIKPFTEVYSSKVFDKLTGINVYEIKKSSKHKNYLLDMLSEKLMVKLSEEQLIANSYFSPEFYPSDFGKEEYVPLINGMYFPKFGLKSYLINEKFSDINGNAIKFNNLGRKISIKDPVYTSLGSGKIKAESKDKFIVSIINGKEYLIDKDKIYISESSIFSDYIRTLENGSYADTKLNSYNIQPTRLDSKKESEELDTPDNTIELEAKLINGLFSLYTLNIDVDNIRLENYNFNKFTNMFIIKIHGVDELNSIVEKLNNMNADAISISAIQQSYREFEKDPNIILPLPFNYFLNNQIKEENIKPYPLIWDKNFFIIFNGNFYQKQGYKLSRKFEVNLIKSLYIQSFRELKDCKFELIKISKTLNIINFQEVLGFLNRPFEKRRIIKIATPDSKEYQTKLTEDALKFLKEKESKLKEHIKKIRSEKYEQ